MTSKPLEIYVGTYTDKEGSRGIYRVTMNPQSGELSKPALAAETTAPSFIALHPNGKFLYAVNESSNGEVTSFALQRDGSLRRLNQEIAPGSGPCHVSIDHAGRHVFTAAYGDGSFACLPIRADGSLGDATWRFQNFGRGPNHARQEGPHGHSIYAGSGDRFVYACDLGTDEVLRFRFDAGRGNLETTNPRSFKPGAGAGPRHLTFHQSGRFVFVNNEMGNSVTSFTVGADDGSLTSLGTISTLPAGFDGARSSTAEIAAHPSGKWLYVSNRGHDSVAVFSIAAEGKLTLLEIVPATVRNPRSFAVDPSGRWLVIAGQNSDDLASFRVEDDGKLRPTGYRASMNKPVCVVFAP